MARYQRENGHHTAKDDPKRRIWYSPCGFWTDNWDSLVLSPRTIGPLDAPGIPVCPHCKVPGFQIRFDLWIDAVKHYEEEGHPRYEEWINTLKDEKCTGVLPDLIKKYEMWLKAQESQKS